MHERIGMWEAMMQALPKDCRRVVGGDWNIVQHAHGRSNINNQIFKRKSNRGSLAWNEVK